jgi:uncharacterized repeat protein (TIGR01451 family)
VIQFTVGSAAQCRAELRHVLRQPDNGRVFADNGAGGGIANNGVKAGTEAGLAGITVILKGRLGAEVTRTVSVSDGTFILWFRQAAAGTITPCCQPAIPRPAARPEHSGGSYTRTGVNYTTGSGRNDSGVTFGMVAPNTLAPNGAQTAEPGTACSTPTPTRPPPAGRSPSRWPTPPARQARPGARCSTSDSNCSANAGGQRAHQVTTAITVTAGQKICLIVKQFVPAGAGLGAQNTVTLSAAFSYTNAAPALAISTVRATDITTVGLAGDLALGKLVGNVTQAIAAATSVAAKPGDTLQYTLTATNNGTQPLSTLLVSDSTPAFTNFVAAACPGVLPAGITGCAVTTQPAVGAQGALQWTFTGSLAPGAQLVVTYRVKVDQ